MRSNFGLVFSLFLTIYLFGTHLQSGSNTEQLGSTECVLLSPLSDTPYQQATCLTHEYTIHRKYICREIANKCSYQCQYERHEQQKDNCKCFGDQDIVTKPPDLDQQCYSPSGDNCNWYRECLERRYACEGTEHCYAIEFGEKLCNIFSEGLYSEIGMRWVVSVRKCLQEALVPLLRPQIPKTCADIRKDAFQSHLPCYVEAQPGSISACDLPIMDRLKIFWILFSNLQFSDLLLETGRQIIDTLHACYIDRNV